MNGLRKSFFWLLGPVAVAVAAAWLFSKALPTGSYGEGLSFAKAAFQQGTPESGPTVSEARKSGTKLELGEAASPRGKDIAIPLHFTVAEGETIGRIRAELVASPGPWRFRKAEVPPKSFWKITARQKREPGQGKAGEPDGRIVIELNVTAAGRAIREGLLGHLHFSAQEPAGLSPPAVAVRKLETSPPEPESVPTASSESPLPLPADPPINPQVNCFFFSH